MEGRDPIPALEAARELTDRGALQDVIGSSVLKVRYPNGSAGLRLVAELADGPPSWHAGLPRNESEDALRTRLLKEHAHFRRARDKGFEVCERIRRHAGTMLAAAATEVTLLSCGLNTPSSRQEIHPTAELLISALGRDAKVGIDNVRAVHEFDLDADLRRIVERQRGATAYASGSRPSRAIDAIAACVLQLCGLDPAHLIGELEWCDMVPFESRPEKIAGEFTWRECAISANIRHENRCRIVGNVLTLPIQRLAQTYHSALMGKPLIDLIDLGAVSRVAVIEYITEPEDGNVQVMLRRDRLPLIYTDGIGRS